MSIIGGAARLLWERDQSGIAAPFSQLLHSPPEPARPNKVWGKPRCLRGNADHHAPFSIVRLPPTTHVDYGIPPISLLDDNHSDRHPSTTETYHGLERFKALPACLSPARLVAEDMSPRLQPVGFWEHAMTQRHAANNAIWTDDDDGFNHGSAVDAPVANASGLFAAFALPHAPGSLVALPTPAPPSDRAASNMTEDGYLSGPFRECTRLQRLCTYRGSATPFQPQQSGLSLRLVYLKPRCPSLSPSLLSSVFSNFSSMQTLQVWPHDPPKDQVSFR